MAAGRRFRPLRSEWPPEAALAIDIRDEAPGDEPAIEAVIIAAFLRAPHTDHTEQFVVRELRAAGQLVVSLVAERDGVIVGHVALSPVTISDGSSGWLGIGPLSVEPALQGTGIGSQLMREALRRAEALGAPGCVLLGDPAYYHRFGFRAVPGLTYANIPPGPFQALSFGGPMPQGDVTYHPAFDATE